MLRQDQDTIGRGTPEASSGGFGAELLTHLRVSVIATVVLAIIVSGIYPAVVWGLAQAAHWALVER